MREPTYMEMTADHLGYAATAIDLGEFRDACEAYQDRTDCSDSEATDYIYGRGDWLRRAYDELTRSPYCPECDHYLGQDALSCPTCTAGDYRD